MWDNETRWIYLLSTEGNAGRMSITGGVWDFDYDIGDNVPDTAIVRVRARQFDSWPEPEDDYRGFFWTDWTEPVQIRDIMVSSMPPILEIATIIGVGGIGVALLNNYWSGRREKQMTEVTRTAAVDERFMELYDASRETEFQRTMAEVLYQYEWTDYDDFLEKYGPRTNVDAWAKIQSLAQYFEGIGVLVRTDSVNLDQVHQLLGVQIVDVWEKLGDMILERRKRQMNPAIYSAFESLYYAIKNYSQQGPPPKDDVRVHRF